MPTPTPASSSTRPWIWILALALVAGLAWWLWPDRDAPELADDDASDSGSAPDSIEASEREPSRRDLALAAKASVSGTVRTRGAGPIAGAQVCATPMWNQLRGLGDGKPICTRTGADGHYRLEGLWPVRMQLAASAAAHEPKAWRSEDEQGRRRDYVALVAGRETKPIDFELQPGGVKLAGQVKDLGGGEIEGALVIATSGMWYGVGQASAVARSDAEGRFELWVRKGEVGVTASAEGYGSTWKTAVAPSALVELFLTPESVLVGQVVHAQTGEPVADVTVDAAGERWMGGDEPVRSDAEGRFRIGGLGPGTYKPVATSDHFYGQAQAQVQLGLGQTSEPIEIRVHPMALIEGRVIVAGSGEACPEGNVSILRTDKDDRAWAMIDDEGHVSLRGARAGEYEVTVACQGYVAEDRYPNLTLGEDDLLDLVWEVREGQAIRGVVVDSEGAPVGEASVSARMIADVANPRGQTTSAWARESEDDGSFELVGLLAGRYEVSAWAEQPSPDAPQIVELAPGSDRNDVRIELLATGSIAGRVIDEHGTPQPGISVRASPLGKWAAASTMTDDQGNFVLEYVRTGEVRVEASEGGWGDTLRAPGSTDDDVQGELITVVAGERVEVELEVESRTGVIRGRVLDEGGAPVDDAFIHAERMSDSATADAGRSVAAVRWDWGSEPILSEVDGSFTIPELAAGTYVVRADRRGGGEAIVEGVALGSTIELTIESPGSMAGKVVVPGGQPPDKFRVSASDRKQGLYFGDEFFRTEDGAWELGAMQAGKYEVSVESSLGTAMIEVELAAGERREGLELSLQPRVTVRGRLVDIDTRAPISGMRVSISPDSGSFSFSTTNERKEVSDAEGRFEVGQAPTGDVQITVSPRNFGETVQYDWSSFPREIATAPAEQDIGDLELVARRLTPEQVAGDLGFELQQSEMDVEPEDRQVRVGLIRPGGPAAGSELAVGDVIERVDGKSVEGANSSRFRGLTRVPAGTVLEIGIKDGKTVTITVGPPIE
ncbi:carboxypeptidase regulatory-like domain-containing protein [Nannocystaceae bacterium ST9]